MQVLLRRLSSSSPRPAVASDRPPRSAFLCPLPPVLHLALALLLLGPAGAHSSASVDLGDITALDAPQAEPGRLDGTATAVQTYRFTLTAAQAVTLGLRLQHADADLYLEAADGTLLDSSEQPGPLAEWIEAVLPAGAYAVQIEAREAGKNPYIFYYEVAEPGTAAPRHGGRDGGGVLKSDWLTTMQAEAVPLGDITALAAQAWQRGRVTNGKDDSYRFTLTESKEVALLLTDMAPAGGDCNLFVYDGDMNNLYSSTASRSADDEIAETLRAGTYTIVVRGFFYHESQLDWELSYALGYTVSAASEELPALEDDFSADTSTTGTLTLADGSGEATGDIEFIGDHDWFAVALEAGQTYEMHLRGPATDDDATLGGPSLQLYDADGAVVPLTADAGSGVAHDAWQFFTPPAAQTYYIEARAYRDTGGIFPHGATGTYTVSVDEYTSPEGDDYPSFVTETPPVLEAGGVLRGELETVGDRDWFALDLVADVDYTITALDIQQSFGTLSYGRLYGIYDADGRAVTDGVTRHHMMELVFQPSQTGRYYVSMDADDRWVLGDTQADWDDYHANLRPFYDDYKWAIGTYTILLRGSVDPNTDYPDSMEVMFLAAEEVRVGSPVAGALERGNQHTWYTVVGLEADKSYRIDLKGASSGDGGTLRDPYLRVIQVRRTAAGNIADSSERNDDNSGVGYNSQLEVAGGEYYLVAGASHEPDALEDGYRATGTYTLAVTELTPVATDGATRVVAVGGVARSTIRTAADCDRVEVHLKGGKTYRIDLAGASTSTEDGALPDPYLGGLYDPAGALIPGTTNDDGGPGRNSQVIFTPRETGFYEVAACAYGAGVGTYTLSVEEIEDDYPADTGTKGTVAVGGAATGEVQAAGDRDWFRVELAAGTSYVIELAGVLDCKNCTLLEPALHGLYDAAGEFIAGTTPAAGAGHPSQVPFAPPTTATYYVAAGAHGDGVGTYTVRVHTSGRADP